MVFNVRVQGTQPTLLTHNDCEFVIKWVTEYACAESTLTSETCQLQETANNHRVTVDLTPLASGVIRTF